MVWRVINSIFNELLVSVCVIVIYILQKGRVKKKAPWKRIFFGLEPGYLDQRIHLSKNEPAILASPLGIPKSPRTVF